MAERHALLRKVFWQQGPVVVVPHGSDRKPKGDTRDLADLAQRVFDQSEAQSQLTMHFPAAIATSAWGELICAVAWELENYEVVAATCMPGFEGQGYELATWDLLQARRPDLAIADKPELKRLNEAVEEFLAANPGRAPIPAEEKLKSDGQSLTTIQAAWA